MHCHYGGGNQRRVSPVHNETRLHPEGQQAPGLTVLPALVNSSMRWVLGTLAGTLFGENHERYFRKLVHLHRHDPDLGHSCQWGLLAHQDIDR